jgi:hypothetical protein
MRRGAHMGIAWGIWRGFSWGAIVTLLLATLFAPPGRALAAEQTPEAFLHAIYDNYVGDPAKAPGVPLDTHAIVRRYFEPSLAALIIKDMIAAAKRDEPPTLDGDAFVDAQEWQIATIDIQMQRAGDDKATGVVSFKNFDKPMTVTLQLVKLKGAWKISEITWGEESLRGIYKPTPK